MVKLGKVFIYLLFFVLALMYFTPKQNVYYLAEKELQKHQIIISKEDVKDNVFDLNISNANISYQLIDSAKISSIKINIFAFYNVINIKDITLNELSENFIPLHIKTVNISHSILSPLTLKASANGEFGELKATLSLDEKILHVDLKPSKLMLKKHIKTLNIFKKSKNGEYVYEKAI